MTCKGRLEQAWSRKDKPAPAACVRVFGREFLLWDEQRLLLLVLLGGPLAGCCTCCGRSGGTWATANW